MMTKLTPFLSRIEKEETVYFRNVIISNKKVAETHTRLITRFLQTLFQWTERFIFFRGKRVDYVITFTYLIQCYFERVLSHLISNKLMVFLSMLLFTLILREI